MGTDPISVPQANLIAALLDERLPDEHTRREAESVIADGTSRQASGLIDRLKNAPYVERSAAIVATPPTGLPAGSPGSRHPFTPGELAEMNERSVGQREGVGGGAYGPDGYMIAGAVDALDR